MPFTRVTWTTFHLTRSVGASSRAHITNSVSAARINLYLTLLPEALCRQPALACARRRRVLSLGQPCFLPRPHPSSALLSKLVGPQPRHHLEGYWDGGSQTPAGCCGRILGWALGLWAASFPGDSEKDQHLQSPGLVSSPVSSGSGSVAALGPVFFMGLVWLLPWGEGQEVDTDRLCFRNLSLVLK